LFWIKLLALSEKYAAFGSVMLTAANVTGAGVLFVTVRFSVRGKQNASGLRFNVLGAAVTTPGRASTVKCHVFSRTSALPTESFTRVVMVAV
jgi:hypothetical protein